MVLTSLPEYKAADPVGLLGLAIYTRIYETRACRRISGFGKGSDLVWRLESGTGFGFVKSECHSSHTIVLNFREQLNEVHLQRIRENRSDSFNQNKRLSGQQKGFRAQGLLG